MKAYEALVEWHWQGKCELLGGKPLPVPICPRQVPQGFLRYWAGFFGWDTDYLLRETLPSAWPCWPSVSSYVSFILRLNERYVFVIGEKTY